MPLRFAPRSCRTGPLPSHGIGRRHIGQDPNRMVIVPPVPDGATKHVHGGSSSIRQLDRKSEAMMAFSPQEAAQVRQAIEALNAEFVWLIDHRNGAGVSELFTFSGT